MDAYLEEELYDLLTYCALKPDASDFDLKKQRALEIGKELYADGGTDAMENMFYSIEFRIKEEIGKDAKPYRAWWNNGEWRYYQSDLTNPKKILFTDIGRLRRISDRPGRRVHEISKKKIYF